MLYKSLSTFSFILERTVKAFEQKSLVKSSENHGLLIRKALYSDQKGFLMWSKCLSDAVREAF